MGKKQKRRKYISAIVSLLVIATLTYQCISGLVTGNWTWDLNYFGQPVNPGSQLIVLVILAFVGVLSVWNFFFGSKETEKEKRKREKAEKKYSHIKYPFQNMPWE